jgi:hypothetical protein
MKLKNVLSSREDRSSFKYVEDTLGREFHHEYYFRMMMENARYMIPARVTLVHILTKCC